MTQTLTSFRPGDRVRLERTSPTKGNWASYRGRTGTVVTINSQRFPSGQTYVEVGISFAIGAAGRIAAGARPDVEVWCLPDEVVAISG